VPGLSSISTRDAKGSGVLIAEELIEYEARDHDITEHPILRHSWRSFVTLPDLRIFFCNTDVSGFPICQHPD
jgi:hypothetical protein